jgi:hypothetical protein
MRHMHCTLSIIRDMHSTSRVIHHLPYLLHSTLGGGGGGGGGGIKDRRRPSTGGVGAGLVRGIVLWFVPLSLLYSTVGENGGKGRRGRGRREWGR